MQQAQRDPGHKSCKLLTQPWRMVTLQAGLVLDLRASSICNLVTDSDTPSSDPAIRPQKTRSPARAWSQCVPARRSSRCTHSRRAMRTPRSHPTSLFAPGRTAPSRTWPSPSAASLGSSLGAEYDLCRPSDTRPHSAHHHTVSHTKSPGPALLAPCADARDRCKRESLSPRRASS